MARPTIKNEHEKRTERMYMRMTLAERLHVEQQAEAAGVSLSDYLRQRALEYAVPAKRGEASTTVIAELNMVGSNLHQYIRDDRFGRGSRSAADWDLLYDRLGEVLEKVAASYGS